MGVAFIRYVSVQKSAENLVLRKRRGYPYPYPLLERIIEAAKHLSCQDCSGKIARIWLVASFIPTMLGYKIDVESHRLSQCNARFRLISLS